MNVIARGHYFIKQKKMTIKSASLRATAKQSPRLTSPRSTSLRLLRCRIDEPKTDFLNSLYIIKTGFLFAQ